MFPAAAEACWVINIYPRLSLMMEEEGEEDEEEDEEEEEVHLRPSSGSKMKVNLPV